MPPPPIIEELDDDDDDDQSEELTEQQLASSALEKCHQILIDAQRPIDDRYNDIVTVIPPIERYLEGPSLPSEDFVTRLLELLVPNPALAPEETKLPDDDDYRVQLRALSTFHTFSWRLLSRIPTYPPLSSNSQLIKTLACFASPEYAWTTEKNQLLVQHLFKAHRDTIASPSALLSILRELKPLFTLPAPTPSTSQLTAAGRIALRPSTNTSIAVAPPPYTQHLYSIPVLEWILKDALPAESLEEAWPLLIPPILTLNDSTSVQTRIQAVGLTRTLLYRLRLANSTFLKRTGLGPVFWDATTPHLSWLPPLTPESHSYALLKVTFPCLLELAITLEPSNTRPYAALLDVLVRDGFLRGITYAGEHISIATILVVELRSVVSALGIYAVRHLQSITTVLSEVLANPLGNSWPPLLEEALVTLLLVARVCWVRLGKYVPEILRGVVECWKRVVEDGGGLTGVMDKCRTLVAVVKAVVEAEEGGAERWRVLMRGVVDVEGEVVRRLLE